MTVIDERILIPTAPDTVWDVLSNINDNPRWQVDCQSVSFLTSLRSGPGVRWRYTSANGQEYVVEITAWYDGLGYEYTFIDGAPFRSSKGTIRLQEIAEGTIVQWTLNYETGGMLAGLRDAVTIRRHYDAVMVDSLKSLWTFMKESGRARSTHEARSLMRDALDYEARAQYKPRHPSRVDTGDKAELITPLDEPPVSDEDTRPNPTLAAEPAESAPAVVDEAVPSTSEADEEWETPSAPPDISRFQRPSVPAPAPAEVSAPPEPEEMAPAETPEPIPEEPAVPTPVEAEPQIPVSQAQEIEPVVVDAETAAEPEGATPETPAEEITKPEVEEVKPAAAPLEPSAADGEFGPRLDTSKLDTREVSIWEVFGLPRPSETRPMKPITEDELVEETDQDAPAIAPVAEDVARASTSPAPVAEIAASTAPEQAAPSAAEPRVLPPAAVPIMSEDTRPNVILPASREPVVTVFIPGFRMRARRGLVHVRRRL